MSYVLFVDDYLLVSRTVVRDAIILKSIIQIYDSICYRQVVLQQTVVAPDDPTIFSDRGEVLLVDAPFGWNLQKGPWTGISVGYSDAQVSKKNKVDNNSRS